MEKKVNLDLGGTVCVFNINGVSISSAQWKRGQRQTRRLASERMDSPEYDRVINSVNIY